MMKLFWESSFKRAFKRYTRRQPELKDKIFASIEKLTIDLFQPSLRTHKLSGQLGGLWACWVDMIVGSYLHLCPTLKQRKKQSP